MRRAWKAARDGAGLVRVVGDSAALELRAKRVTGSVYDARVLHPQVRKALPLFPGPDLRAIGFPVSNLLEVIAIGGRNHGATDQQLPERGSGETVTPA